MSISKDSKPPPMIGKIGPYTVFVTPPSTPKPPAETVPDTPIKKKVIVSPPVQPPPPQFEKSSADVRSSSLFGLFSNAVSKVQTVHSGLDERLARWFGLNQSKYQWALDDYYENNGVEKESTKAKETSSKVQCV